MHQSDVVDRSLFSLSWPIFIDILLHMATLLINTYMVSHISSSYLAAMGVGNQVFDLFITIFNFISVGCTVVIAQYLGSGKRDKASQAIHISIAFNFVLGFTCALMTIFFGYKILKIMNLPENLMADGFAYLHILGICLIPEAVSIILAACLRVYGKSKAAMFVTLIANLLTIVGNMIVLYGFFGLPQYGLEGVAWSTVFGRTVAVVLLFGLLFSGLKIKLEIKWLIHWSKNMLSKILHVGLPSAGENLVWILQYMTAQAFIGLMGETSLAAQTLYFQLSLFIMLFGISTSIGNEIMVGHLVGAKRFEDAYVRGFKSLRIGVIVTVGVVLAFWIFREPLLAIMTKDEAIIQLLLPLCLLSVFLEPGRTFNIVMVNALRASGDARFPLFIATICMWGISIPLGYFLGITMGMGILGIWIGFFFDEWVRGIINAWRWKSKRWQTKRLDI
ncbi:MATE family efflux transporter [Xenorhabdus szentirmaii]|uniref:Na+ driven multidrug efflux pump n=2 Tax=Xenorhabdus szentirmaii TaxID=290112 RepID=W1IWB1_9GAMM|nr:MULTISPECIES: MATE family efflux transporter [Xenorhabdus]MBD2781901.1 MATE family efflux transporter [Xenorhabdus sp. 38]MBD2792115.1 MATE family efflux transporter [Xenorhabdus sp. CUL]MBD2802136.1 MATE family efflux transporter [Xenorhabdus sp. M]MBD2803545.1 MATE family efflux transporter [Xenorhabdus sp. ZM]MBD2822685.1 MATE family efflux transporter [Xenorhabdus sp. 42]